MTEDKWDSIIERIKSTGTMISEGVEHLHPGPGIRKFIVFTSPDQSIMMLEYLLRPRIAGKEVHASKRIGGNVQVKYTYDTQELVGTLKAYKKDGDKWEAIAPIESP